MEEQLDDFKSRLDELDLARRRLGRSIAGSAIGLRRVLRVSGEPLPPMAESSEHAGESWPRRMTTPARSYPGTAVLVFLFGLFGLVVLGAVVQRHWQAGQATRETVTVETMALKPAVPSIPQAPVIAPSVVRVRAIRPCRVRIIIDGTALDWRELKEGDEFVWRPTREILIDTNNPAALAATVNGAPIRIGDLRTLFPSSAR